MTMGIWTAPRTHAEFMALFNCFERWGLCWTVMGRAVALRPEDWPPHFWWSCPCGDENRHAHTQRPPQT